MLRSNNNDGEVVAKWRYKLGAAPQVCQEELPSCINQSMRQYIPCYTAIHSITS